MSQIEQLLKYQQEDEKLIKLEQEAASSEERKNYVQAKNFMVKAPEKLEQIDNKAAELEAMASRLSRAYEELAEALQRFRRPRRDGGRGRRRCLLQKICARSSR